MLTTSSNEKLYIPFQMMVEEVKKAKELVNQPKVKGGDDEPDWQNVRHFFSLDRFVDQNIFFIFWMKQASLLDYV